MGMLHISMEGSFNESRVPISRTFSAMKHGHAHAVAQAIEYLSTVVLPKAIDRDHKLHGEGNHPSKGFIRE